MGVVVWDDAKCYYGDESYIDQSNYIINIHCKNMNIIRPHPIMHASFFSLRVND